MNDLVSSQHIVEVRCVAADVTPIALGLDVNQLMLLQVGFPLGRVVTLVAFERRRRRLRLSATFLLDFLRRSFRRPPPGGVSFDSPI